MNSNYYILTNLISEDERRVITSIIKHIENGSSKVGIKQIASENFVSTAFIMKLCKRLGFSGYSELYYMLAKSNGLQHEGRGQQLPKLIDNYDEEKIADFCRLLNEYRNENMFVVGAGFAGNVAEYIVNRLAVFGFLVYNHVHFYDFMLFRQESTDKIISNIKPSILIAISQSGETDTIINDIMEAKKKDFKIISFTRRPDSTLASLSDLSFSIDTSRQTLISAVPNQFFGKVILAFEELMGEYFK